MFRKEKVLNKHLHKKEIQRRRDILDKNLVTIKNRKMNFQTPFMFSSQDKQKRLEIRERERLIKILSDNSKISLKINHLMNHNSLSNHLGTYHKKLYKDVNFKEIKKEKRQRSLMRITKENFNLLRKIDNSSSYYKKNDFIKNEKERLNKLKMVCEFPLILKKPEETFQESQKQVFQTILIPNITSKRKKKQKKLNKKKKKKIHKTQKESLMNKENLKKNQLSNNLNNDPIFYSKDRINPKSKKNMKPRFEVRNSQDKIFKNKYRKTCYKDKSCRKSGRTEVIYHTKNKEKTKPKKMSTFKHKQQINQTEKLPKIQNIKNIQKNNMKTPKFKSKENDDFSKDMILESESDENSQNSEDSMSDIFDKAPIIQESKSLENTDKNCQSESEDNKNDGSLNFNSNFKKNFTKFYTKKE